MMSATRGSLETLRQACRVATGHVKVIPRFYHDPFVALGALPQRLHFAGDDKKIFRVRMTMKWN